MFGVELYFLGCGMMAWAASMQEQDCSPRYVFALVVCWPVAALVGTILFLFPSLDNRIEDRVDEPNAAELRREQRDSEEKN